MILVAALALADDTRPLNPDLPEPAVDFVVPEERGVPFSFSGGLDGLRFLDRFDHRHHRWLWTPEGGLVRLRGIRLQDNRKDFAFGGESSFPDRPDPRTFAADGSVVFGRTYGRWEAWNHEGKRVARGPWSDVAKMAPWSADRVARCRDVRVEVGGLRGKAEAVLSHPCQDVQWTPDGSDVLVLADGTVKRIRLDGTEVWAHPTRLAKDLPRPTHGVICIPLPEGVANIDIASGAITARVPAGESCRPLGADRMMVSTGTHGVHVVMHEGAAVQVRSPSLGVSRMDDLVRIDRNRVRIWPFETLAAMSNDPVLPEPWRGHSLLQHGIVLDETDADTLVLRTGRSDALDAARAVAPDVELSVSDDDEHVLTARRPPVVEPTPPDPPPAEPATRPVPTKPAPAPPVPKKPAAGKPTPRK